MRILWKVVLLAVVVSGNPPLLPADQSECEKTKDETPQSLSLELSVVDELRACRNDGYPQPGSPGKHCKKLKVDEVLQWKDEVIFHKKNLPPCKIKLPAGILEDQIKPYMAEQGWTKPSPDKRKSILMLFHLPNAAGKQVTFSRTQGGNPHEEIWSAPKPLTGTLEDGGYWIYHAGLHTFFPANRMRWSLTVGEATWQFEASDSD